MAPSLCGGGRVRARAVESRPGNDRTALHAPHHRSRFAADRKRGRKAFKPPPGGRHLPGSNPVVEFDWGAEGLSSAHPEREGHAFAPARIVRPDAEFTSAQSLGDEDWWDFVTAHRGRGYNDGAVANGGDVP